MPEEPKKMALLRILQILTKYSDADHLLTQQDIIDKLNDLYNISLERKAVAKNISLLKEADYDIIDTRKGVYLAGRIFEDGELHFLIDTVTGNPFVKTSYTEDLTDKLRSFSNNYFNPNPSKVNMGKEGDFEYNSEFFMNVEAIYKAIENKVNIHYDYNNYDENLHLKKTSSFTASPYKLITHNQGYYVMAYAYDLKCMVFHRIERMTNIEVLKQKCMPIEKVPGMEGAQLRNFLEAARPYLYADKPEEITMIVSNYGNIISQLVDWLGKGITIEDAGDEYGLLRVKVLASKQAVKYWAMQYSGYVEITDPPELHEEILMELQAGVDQYTKY